MKWKFFVHLFFVVVCISGISFPRTYLSSLFACCVFWPKNKFLLAFFFKLNSFNIENFFPDNVYYIHSFVNRISCVYIMYLDRLRYRTTPLPQTTRGKLIFQFFFLTTFTFLKNICVFFWGERDDYFIYEKKVKFSSLDHNWTHSIVVN